MFRTKPGWCLPQCYNQMGSKLLSHSDNAASEYFNFAPLPCYLELGQNQIQPLLAIAEDDVG
jgi:hypothetical protein